MNALRILLIPANRNYLLKICLSLLTCELVHCPIDNFLYFYLKKKGN